MQVSPNPAQIWTPDELLAMPLEPVAIALEATPFGPTPVLKEPVDGPPLDAETTWPLAFVEPTPLAFVEPTPLAPFVEPTPLAFVEPTPVPSDTTDGVPVPWEAV